MKVKALAVRPVRARRAARFRATERREGIVASMRPLIAASAAAASLGLLLVSPCCPAPSPALGSEAGTGETGSSLGVTVTAPAVAQDGGTDKERSAEAQDGRLDEDGGEGLSPEVTSPDNPSENKGESPDLDVPGSHNGPEQQTADADSERPAQGEGDESAANEDERQGTDAQDGVLEARLSGDKATGCTETESSNPMDVLLANVERQRGNGADVEVVSADPATGRVVYA